MIIFIAIISTTIVVVIMISNDNNHHDNDSNHNTSHNDSNNNCMVCGAELVFSFFIVQESRVWYQAGFEQLRSLSWVQLLKPRATS